MITNLLCTITGLFGLILTTLILRNYKSNGVMNIYMVLLIFIISLRFFLSGIIHFTSNIILNDLYLKFSHFSLIVIPLGYLYFKNLTKDKKFERSEFLHFIFPICYFIIILIINNNFIPPLWIKTVMFLLFLGYAVTYITLSYRILKTNIWHKKSGLKIITKQNKKLYNWTLFLFVMLLISTTRLLISLYIEIVNNVRTTGFSLQWVASMIWLFLLIKILITPEILYGYTFLNEKLQENRILNLVLREIWQTNAITPIKNSQHLALTEKVNNQLQNYFEEIEKISFQQDFFRDPKITLGDLATKLSIPKSHLSYLYKYHSTISFSEYKKIIRIQDAIKLIEKGYLKNNTLDSLSKKTGFTSYNPFFTSFKEITGSAPAEYSNNIHSPI